MKLLITGGCGFLGSNLAAHGIAQGLDVCVFDSLCRQGGDLNLAWLRTHGRFEFVHGDIRNSNDVSRLIMQWRPDVIFHLSGQVAMTTSISNPRLDFEVNALGTLNVLEAVREFSDQTMVVYSSTNKVYGDLEQYGYDETATRYVCSDRPNGFAEDAALSFHSPYGCSKGAADQYMQDYARIFGLKTVVFRHSSMYGGRQFATYDQGWIGWFCQKALEAKRGISDGFSISGNGKQVRDVLHAEDMISLYFKVVEKIDLVRGDVFNVGGGLENSLSLLELFAKLESMLGVKLKYSMLPVRQSDQKVFIADISKAQNLIGWRPVVSVDEGLARMLAWLESGG